jgi:hypothetical protein
LTAAEAGILTCAHSYSEDELEDASKMNNQEQNQWRVTFYEVGEEPIVEVMSSFADAWALAQPNPEDDGLDWRFVGARVQIKARFDAGEQIITVCWVNGVNGTYNVIERL